jgi:hypothetical protein
MAGLTLLGSAKRPPGVCFRPQPKRCVILYLKRWMRRSRYARFDPFGRNTPRTGTKAIGR